MQFTLAIINLIDTEVWTMGSGYFIFKKIIINKVILFLRKELLISYIHKV